MDWVSTRRRAEQYAKDNPDKVDQGVEGGEKFAEEHTGHRYDQQIGEGGGAAERLLGADPQSGRQAGAEGPQPDGGQRQEQVQEDAENDDQEANHS